MKLVLDSSAIVKFFLQESLSDKARALLVAIGEGAHEAHIPSLACYEVLGVLSQHLATQDEIGRYLSSLYNLIDSNAIRMHLVKQRLLNKAAEIACTDTHGQGHISSYDATFHALALPIDATLITNDKSHYRKTRDSIGQIVLLDNMKLGTVH